MTPPDALPTGLSVDDCDWLHRLARQLVAGEDEARDLSQSALLVALDQRRGGRAWLAGVLRNLWRSELRGRRHRSDRESQSIENANAPAADEVNERLELQRLLVDAVQELDEPSRTAIVLRHFDDMKPREIARRLAIPVKTVHSRLERAHHKLRGKLDNEFGGERRAWVMTLLPLSKGAGSTSASLSAIAGGLVMTAPVKFSLFLAAGALALWFAWDSHSLPGQASTLAETDFARDLEAPLVREARSSSPVESTGSEALVADATLSAETVAMAPVPGGGPTKTRLTLRALKKGTATVVEGVQLTIESPDSNSFERLILLTDAQGLAQATVPAGARLRIDALPTRLDAQDLDQAGPGQVTLRVPERVQSHHVDLELPHGLDRMFWGRVVRAENGQAIRGATAHLVPPAGVRPPGDALARSDSAGRFRVPFAAWQSGKIEVSAEGRAPAWFDMTAVESDAANPGVIELAVAAQIVGHVWLPGDVDDDGWSVQVSTGHDLFLQPRGITSLRGLQREWERDLPNHGNFELAGIPPGVELSLSLFSRDDLFWRSPDLLLLEPGEERRVDIDLRNACLVHGEVRDQDDEPIPHRELWVHPVTARYGVGKSGVHFSKSDESSIIRRTHTNAKGEYELPSMFPGDYWIGPAPADDDVAAFARLLSVTSQHGRTRHNFTPSHKSSATRGRYVEGELSGAGWHRGSQAEVHAKPRNGHGGLQVITDAYGRFRIGPLQDVEYVMYAIQLETRRQSDLELLSSRAKRVRLNFERLGSLAGIVVDGESRSPSAAQLHLVTGASGSRSAPSSPSEPGHFRFEGLAADTYTVTATTADGRFASLAGITAGGTRSVDDLVLELEPGAFLEIDLGRVRRLVRCSLTANGRRISDFTLRRGQAARVCVPTGFVIATIYEKSGRSERVVDERSVEVTAGETYQLTFDTP